MPQVRPLAGRHQCKLWGLKRGHRLGSLGSVQNNLGCLFRGQCSLRGWMGLCCKLIAVQPFSLLSPAAFIHLQKVFLSKLPRNNMHANLCMRVGFLKKQHNTFGTRSCLRKQILKPHFACIAHWLAESENYITCAVPERLLSCQCWKVKGDKCK